MSIFFSEEYSGFSKKAQVIYTVKSKQGAVACATEEIYKNVQNLYLKNDFKAIESEMKSKNCMLLESGEELDKAPFYYRCIVKSCEGRNGILESYTTQK